MLRVTAVIFPKDAALGTKMTLVITPINRQYQGHFIYSDFPGLWTEHFSSPSKIEAIHIIHTDDKLIETVNYLAQTLIKSKYKTPQLHLFYSRSLTEVQAVQANLCKEGYSCKLIFESCPKSSPEATSLFD